MSEVVLYYKATRPDGTDFFSGTIDYAGALASGEVVRHPKAGDPVDHDASTYLSVSVSAADCTGFRWPCRLFRVEPDDPRESGDYPSKRTCKSLRVVEELPAWQAFGPNGEQVVGIIEKASRLTTDQARRLAAAWAVARAAAYAAYDDRVAQWNARTDREKQYPTLARDAAWAADARRPAAIAAALETPITRRRALQLGAAAGGAAGACVVRDLITKEQFDILAGPWVSVMGPIE